MKSISLQEDQSRHVASEMRSSTDLKRRTKAITFLGGFGLGNFGNEITLQAILHHQRRLAPNAETKCVCTDPVATAALHNIASLPISRTLTDAWKATNSVSRAIRSIVIGIPNEVYRWIDAFRALKGTNVLIVPGTGLLTDAYGLKNWGPYSIFKWSLIARARGCKVLLVSVGAGPVHTYRGKWLVRSAVALANYRSYRDVETKLFLESIGANVAGDEVYPDLAFSIAADIAPKRVGSKMSRRVVGLGLMLYHDKLSSDRARELTYAGYLKQLAEFVPWLLARDYDIRLLIGDLSDRPVIEEFKAVLKSRLGAWPQDHIFVDPIASVDDLLEQISQTDVVVATRFHNVLLALALNKPAISVSFHQKCTSLMQDMGLLEYCQDIKHVNADDLIEQFQRVERNEDHLKRTIQKKVVECREELDKQYALIFGEAQAG